jgi:hypothetical protein
VDAPEQTRGPEFESRRPDERPAQRHFLASFEGHQPLTSGWTGGAVVGEDRIVRLYRPVAPTTTMFAKIDEGGISFKSDGPCHIGGVDLDEILEEEVPASDSQDESRPRGRLSW